MVKLAAPVDPANEGWGAWLKRMRAKVPLLNGQIPALTAAHNSQPGQLYATSAGVPPVPAAPKAPRQRGVFAPPQ